MLVGAVQTGPLADGDLPALFCGVEQNLQQVLGRPLIALPVGAGIRHQFDAACAKADVAPRIAFEASTPLALADLAERGLGVAIVPRSVASAAIDSWAGNHPRAAVGWCWRGGRAVR